MRYLQIVMFIAMTAFSSTVKGELPEPHGQVLLTISGNIEEMNAGDQTEFDRNMLEELGLVDLTTRTPWTEGETNFRGIPMVRLLDLVGPRGVTIRASAANDYIADIPLSTLVDSDAFLAMSMNGKDLTLRDKGPLWIIFPWSDRPDLDRPEIHNYAVWQLLSLRVR